MNGLILQVQTSLFHFMQTVQASLLYLHHQDSGNHNFWFANDPSLSVFSYPQHNPTALTSSYCLQYTSTGHNELILSSYFVQFMSVCVTIWLSPILACFCCRFTFFSTPLLVLSCFFSTHLLALLSYLPMHVYFNLCCHQQNAVNCQSHMEQSSHAMSPLAPTVRHAGLAAHLGTSPPSVRLSTPVGRRPITSGTLRETLPIWRTTTSHHARVSLPAFRDAVTFTVHFLLMFVRGDKHVGHQDTSLFFTSLMLIIVAGECVCVCVACFVCVCVGRGTYVYLFWFHFLLWC